MRGNYYIGDLPTDNNTDPPLRTSSGVSLPLEAARSQPAGRPAPGRPASLAGGPTAIGFEQALHRREAHRIDYAATGDRATRLPPEARRRLAAIRQRWDDANQLLRRAEEDRNELARRRYAGEARLRQLANERIASDHPSVLQARADLDAAKADVAAVDERIAAYHASQPAVLSRIERWLRDSLPPSLVDLPPAEPPRRAKGESIRDAVERRRAKLAHLRADLHAVRSAPIPSARARELIRDQVDRLARAGAPDVLPTIEAGEPAAIPTESFRAELFGFVATEGAPQLAGFAQHSAPAALAFLFWLERERILEVLEREVDALSDDDNALSDDERATRERQVTADILLAEREECALIEAAAAQGMQIEYRPDTDPLAVLNVEADAG